LLWILRWLLLRILRLGRLIVDRRLIGRRLLFLAIAGLLPVGRRLAVPGLCWLLGILLRLPRLLWKRLRIIRITRV